MESDTTIFDHDSRFEVAPKDLKTSIRNKYKRRLRFLVNSLDDFIYHAELRLDAKKAGNIHKRSETEDLLESCKSLREKLPVHDDGTIDEQVYKNLCDFFDIPYDDPADRQ
ncbi:hypothetical protein [Halomonas sp. E19]|uniref:hypothetical protein n=1 Tax=Halomonas sp. E19 TaxID=3397247 RepID=UPI0040338053